MRVAFRRHELSSQYPWQVAHKHLELQFLDRTLSRLASIGRCIRACDTCGQVHMCM